MGRALGLAGLLLCTGCYTTPTKPDDKPVSGGASFPSGPITRPAFAAHQLMDVCWPRPAHPKQVVVMTFYREGDKIQDVMFEARDGASNATGRCLREVALTYPWEPGTVPATLDLTPPLHRPSGWLVMAFVRMLAESNFNADRG